VRRSRTARDGTRRSRYIDGRRQAPRGPPFSDQIAAGPAGSKGEHGGFSIRDERGWTAPAANFLDGDGGASG
ncbi:ANKRD50, partial [Symbiodinium sp. CCMP2456]